MSITDAVTGDWLRQRDYVLSAAGRMDDPAWAEEIRKLAAAKE